MKKRILSLILTLVMAFSLLPNFTITSMASGGGYTGSPDGTGITGSGSTTADPFIISNADQLAYVAQQVNSAGSIASLGAQSACYQLANDIDVSCYASWTPIGIGTDSTNEFKGKFDGACHKITNLKIGTSGTPNTSNRYVGLFGYLNSSGARIKNLGVDVAIYSNSSFSSVGGLVGSTNNGSLITNCYSTGTVTSINTYLYNIGGLVGGGMFYATNCYSTCNVSYNGNYSIANAGGLTGSTTAPIKNCFATGNVVSGASNVGGLVGNGSYTTILYGYWNNSATQTAGGSPQAKGVGTGTDTTTSMTSTDMQDASFVATLNANLDTIADTTLYLWQTQASNYPTLSTTLWAPRTIDKSNSITVDTVAPVYNATILNGTNTPPANMTVPTITWSTNGTNWNSASGSFAAGTAYKTKYIYTANAGYAFDPTIATGNITVTNIASGSITSLALTNSNRTLTVIVTWPATAATYTVTYNGNGSNGGTVPTDGATYTTGTNVPFANAGTMTRTGYTFLGWNTNQSATTALTSSTMGSSNVTFYAIWTAIPYAVTYNGNGSDGGTVPTDGTTYIIGANVPFANAGTMTRTGCTFLGWNTNQSATTALTSSTMGSSNVTFYAIWTVDTYGITYNLNSGTNNVSNTATYTYGVGLTLSTPTKTGYTFDGWYDNGAFTGTAITSISATDTGAKTVYAKWTAVPQSGGSQISQSSGSPSTLPTGTPVIIDGKTQNIGTEHETSTTTTTTVDQTKLESNISKAADGSYVVVPITTNTTVSAQFVVKNVEDMAAKNMTLTVQTENVAYNLNTSAIDVSALSNAFDGVDTKNIPFTVTIANSSVTVNGANIIVSPVEFTVTASYNGKNVTVDTFSAFVNRTIEITAAQAKQITTAVVVESGGTLRHVPTNVIYKDGKYYAVINSLTNSTYTLINNDVKFNDVQGKWYEGVVNEMASRKIISGVGNNNYAGDKAITRAQFAAIIVRALGLPTNGTSTFSDVESTAWYSGAVATAYQYGIVSGVGYNKFNSDANITREETMTMIYRASKLTKFTALLNARNLAAEFSDYGTQSDWAKEAVDFNLNNNLIVGSNGTFRPKDTITRAEAATIVLRLLQKAELVDVRSKA